MSDIYAMQWANGDVFALDHDKMPETNVFSKARAIMTITKLLTVFDVYDNEPDAFASFTGHVLSVVESQSAFM